MSLFYIDPDISSARTIDKKFYTDLELLDSIKEKLFVSSWQFIGDASLVKDRGDIYPFTLLPGWLDEPLVLTRDKEYTVHLLSNVCTHRGNLIADQACKASHLRCKYHGRLFQADGKFVSMPEFKEVKNFPSKEDDLKRFPLHQWGNWLFSSLDQKRNPGSFLKEMADRVGWMPINDFVFRPELSKDFLVKAHWALYCENYLEGFHIPFVHAGLNAVIDFGNYTTELFRYSNLQLGIAKEEEDCFDLPVGSPDYGKKIAAYYFFVFPNMMFNFYPWGLSVNIVNPLGLAESRVSFLAYLWKEDKLHTGAGSGLEEVEREDEEVVENVQKGIRSRYYSHGRYSVSRERGTHHFHQIISEFMS
ncbi:MAG TPA: aromatic ring-hydroxylating dioxygenase subunit alpha [Puia sp.]|jgi:choline monooxygenase|nr:aromatic ring-hydroxylating dioxygenase subunit alpha [Puia sp.]